MKKLVLLWISVAFLSELHAQGWLTRADFGGTGRHRATGFSIGNKGYVGFGHVNGTGQNEVYKDWWQYDPASNSWTQKADYTAASGTYGAIAFATSTKGYVGGGTAYSTEYFEYNPVTNLWQAISNCPLDVTDQTAFAVNEKGYVISGNQCVEFNPATNSWTFKANLPASLNTWSTSFVVGSSAYVKNGTSLYEYKPNQDTWLIRNSCPGSATAGSSAFSIEGKGYILSGYSGSLANVTKEVWQYNPATNTWLQMEDFPGAARRFSVGFTINDRGYFGLGTNGINFNDFWAFDHFVGQEENTLSVNCTTYPNPTIDEVHFNIGNNAVTAVKTVELYDQLGKLMYTATFAENEYKLSLHDFPVGMYVYTLSIDGKIVKTDHLQKAGI